MLETHPIRGSLGRPSLCNRPRRPKTTVCRAETDSDRQQSQIFGAVTGIALSLTLATTPFSAQASDAAAVGSCLLKSCQTALATCLADAQCVENLVCLQLCNGVEDETACQIKCGDKYADKAIETFTSCAVSEKKCVPQRVDTDAYPVPPDCSLVTNFDTSDFQGRWFITAGLNPLFDIFDCQEHYFASPEPGKLFGKINWRIPKGDNDFIERSTMQRFVQTPENPARLLNHDNEYLHYEDDWYVLAWKPDSYALIYYKGQNDAWKGYGGATLYTRSATIPPEIIPEVSAAAERAGLDWNKFTVTDNTCGPHPPQASIVQEVEKDVEAVEGAVESSLKSFGKGFTILEKGFEKIEKEVLEEEKVAADMIKRFEAEAAMPLAKFLPEGLKNMLFKALM